MSNLYIARSGIITIFPIMSRHATSTTSWGRIRIPIIHFPLKSLALFPTPFLFHTLFPIPEAWIGDLIIIHISFLNLFHYTRSNFHCFVSVPACHIKLFRVVLLKILLKFARMWCKQNR
ncbi:hypothetical protein M9H77_13410 [Catharanthus roseus]|uniref:Uncharacterized protein n=1 Tax=Catharanthus roseus TaxID=4058 RepID=A0ACC0BKC8_CATRO|nr:hypothetical protein M9H77_13410 [Catharanthus roseus]